MPLNLPTQKQKIEKHVHKLRRVKYKTGNVMYFCVLNCNYKVAPALSLGKEVLCNRCGEKFIMNEYSLRLALPHCEKCHKSKNDTRIAKDRLPVEYNPENSVIPIEDPETVRQLIDTGVPPSSLSERLKQAINHTKIEDEDEI